jgi:hypothetical protein
VYSAGNKKAVGASHATPLFIKSDFLTYCIRIRFKNPD